MSNLSDAEVQAYLRRTTRAIYEFDPLDFLNLTVESPKVMGQIMTNPPSRSRPERDPPILIIQPRFGRVLEITAHDGRHRAWAAYKSGMSFPVRILCNHGLSGRPAYFQGQFDKKVYCPIEGPFFRWVG